MFTFNPEEASNAWPEGQYDATIALTEEKVSKSDAPMLVVTYNVYHPDGRKQTLKDYFVAPANGKTGNLFKLGQLCGAVSAAAYDSFRAGKLDHERQLRDKSVLVMLKIERSPDYGDQNKINSYAKLQRTLAKAAGAEDDDEVPF